MDYTEEYEKRKAIIGKNIEKAMQRVSQAEQKKTQSQSVPKTTSSYDMNIISPSDVADSTIRVGTGIQDINAVAQEIRRTQTRDLQQAQENYELKR